VRLAGLLVLALLATGCFRIEIGIRVNADGSGTVSVLTAVDESFADAFDGLGGGDGGDGGGFDLQEAFSEVEQADLPEGASIEPYEEGDFSGLRVTVPFGSGDDVAASIERTFGAVSGDAGGGLTGDDGLFRSLVLERTDDGWRFEAELDLGSEELTGDSDDSPFGNAFAELLLGDASFEIRLALPGQVESHNADDLDGDELIWKVDFLSGEVLTLSAVSTAGSGSSGGGNTVAIVIAVIALVGVIGAAVWFAYTRRSGAAIAGSGDEQ
jgi:hypothetical protein